MIIEETKHYIIGAYSNSMITIQVEDADNINKGTEILFEMSVDNDQDRNTIFIKRTYQGLPIFLNLDYLFKSAWLFNDRNKSSYQNFESLVTIYAFTNSKKFSPNLTIIPSTVNYNKLKEGESVRLGECNKITLFKGYPQVGAYLNYDKDSGFSSSPILLNEKSKSVGRVVDECGIFLRWRNTRGGWSHWLFSDKYSEELKATSLGLLNPRNSLVYDGDKKMYKKSANVYPFGFTAKNTRTLTSEVVVMSEELEEVKSLFVSPEVHVWKGVKGDDVERNDIDDYWERVAVSDGSHKFDVGAQGAHPLSVTIEYVQQKTITQI